MKLLGACALGVPASSKKWTLVKIHKGRGMPVPPHCAPRACLLVLPHERILLEVCPGRGVPVAPRCAPRALALALTSALTSALTLALALALTLARIQVERKKSLFGVTRRVLFSTEPGDIEPGEWRGQ